VGCSYFIARCLAVPEWWIGFSSTLFSFLTFRMGTSEKQNHFMKKLFIAVPLMGMFLFNSCKKETETIIETETIVETVTEIENKTIIIALDPFQQTYYNASLGYSSVVVDYSAYNQGDKKISTLEVRIEATTADGSVYVGSDYIFNLDVDDNVSSQLYISVADKECKSIKVKEVEITTF
jgi:uncharacterized lipoprotein YajG